MNNVGLCAVAIATSLPWMASAQTDVDFGKRCADWIVKKGYSRDYIQQRIGVRPPARARWADNISANELRPGDVVVLNHWPGHVALIEEVERDGAGKPMRLKISSFNDGRGLAWIEKSCEVSGRFGVELTQMVTMQDTSGYWRPPSRSK